MFAWVRSGFGPIHPYDIGTYLLLAGIIGRGIPSISGVGSICPQITFGPGDGLGLKSSSLACMTKV